MSWVTSSSWQTTCVSYVPEAVKNSNIVLVKDNAAKHLLQPAYQAPYNVLKCTNNHFALIIKTRKENIPINHLKPAHLGNTGDHPVETETQLQMWTYSNSPLFKKKMYFF